MADQSVITEVVSKQAEKELKALIEDLGIAINRVNDFKKGASEIKFPSQGKNFIKEANDELSRNNKITTDAEAANKRLTNAIRNKRIAESEAGRQTQRVRQETNAINRETRSLSSEYDRLRLALSKSEKEYRDFAASQGQNSKATQKSLRETQRLRKQVDAINTPIKRLNDNVGNYPSTFKTAIGSVKGLVGAFGIVEGIRLAFDFTKESIAIAKQARGVEFAFKRLGDSGQDAFNRVKKSTRGLLSDLDIQKSLVEFDNFNLSLKESDTLFEFLAVRAAQTGQSVDKLKDSLVEGLSKESKLRIDNLGISAGELNDELDKTPDFVQAVANIAKREIKEAGDILDTSANSTEQWNAALNNLQVSFGKIFTEGGNTGVLGFLAFQVNRISEGFTFLNESLKKVRRGFSSIIEPIQRILQQYPSLNSGIQKFFKLITTPGITVFAKALGFLGAALSGVGAAFEESVKSGANFILSFRAFKDIDFSNPLEAFKKLGEAADNVFKTGVGGVGNTAKAFINGFKEGLKPIEETNDSLRQTGDQIQKNSNSVEESNKKREKEIGVLNDLINQYERLIESQKKDVLFKENSSSEEIEKALIKIKEFRDEIKNLNNDSFDGFDIEDSVLGFEIPKDEEFEDFYVKAIDNIKKSLEGLSDKIDLTFDESLSLAQGYTGQLSETFNMFFQNTLSKYDIEEERNSLFYANLLDNERLSEEERSQLEAEREAKSAAIRKRRIDEERRQARFQKILSIAQIGINTAQAISKSIAQTPLPAGAPFVALNAAIGLAQTAAVIAQPLPQYAEGKDKSDSYTGKAIAGEVPNNTEYHLNKSGELIGVYDRPTLINTEAGDTILKDTGTFQKYALDNSLIGSSLLNSGYLPPIIKMSGQSKDSIDYDKLYGQVSKAVRDGYKKSNHTSNVYIKMSDWGSNNINSKYNN